MPFILPKDEILRRLKEDQTNLKKVQEIFSDAIKFLEDGNSSEKFYEAFDDRLEEAEQLIGRTYFDN